MSSAIAPLRAINGCDLEALLASDEQLYPSGLSLERFSQWTTAAKYPSLSLVYSRLPNLVTDGICIVLPLDPSTWTKLVQGSIKEVELELCDFNQAGDIGLHIWHIERYDGWNAPVRLGDQIWEDLGATLNQIRRSEGWAGAIIGISALCVTPAGRHLFSERLGFTEAPTYSGQVVVRYEKDSNPILVERGELSYLKGEYEVVATCSMFLRTAHDFVANLAVSPALTRIFSPLEH